MLEARKLLRAPATNAAPTMVRPQVVICLAIARHSAWCAEFATLWTTTASLGSTATTTTIAELGYVAWTLPAASARWIARSARVVRTRTSHASHPAPAPAGATVFRLAYHQTTPTCVPTGRETSPQRPANWRPSPAIRKIHPGPQIRTVGSRMPSSGMNPAYRCGLSLQPKRYGFRAAGEGEASGVGFDAHGVHQSPRSCFIAVEEIPTWKFRHPEWGSIARQSPSGATHTRVRYAP